MEPSDLMSSGGEPSRSGPVPGELVVQNGRHAGTRRPLADPVTVLGRSSGCQVRLNVDGVCALHCALFPSPAGLVVRDLGSQTGTFVNDAPVSTAPLRHGDVLRVGPFQFLIHNPEPIPPPGPLELDALRAQAAAVAAQQAALIEEERRLEDRRIALEKREDQLAAHLDERRRTLEAQQDELRQTRSQLHHERGLFEEDCRQRLEEIEKERKEAGVALRLAGDERRRLSALRRLLRRRWRKHWTARERALYRREQELAAQQHEVACDEERLAQEKTALGQARLRHNGDVELGRRQLREGWNELDRAHKAWDLQRQREESALARRAAEVDTRAAELARLRRQLAEAQRHSQSARRTLEREAEGLETRVRNLRTRLAEHERNLARFEPARHPVASAAPRPAVPLPVVDLGPLAGLEDLAGEVADQRRHLLEQWEQFLQAQQEWHDERLALLAEVEEAGRRLDDREAGIALREAELAGHMADIEDRCLALSRQRLGLEGQQARLLASEAEWQASRDGVLAQAEAQAQDADARRATLEHFRTRWLDRRKAEVERLARELKRCRHLQREY